jgi:nicotinamidase-related amidase
MSKKALIIVDLQNDYFPGGNWPLVNTDAAADNAAKLLAAFRAKGDLVVHIRHESGEADATFFVPGTEGAKINAKVANQGNEPVVTKHHINAFRDTELKNILDKNGITDVVISGAMSHMCVDGASRAAADFGYQTTVIHDACATHDQEFNGVKVPAAQAHAAFMAGLAFGYATVTSTKEFLAAK